MKYKDINGIEVWQFNEIMNDLNYCDDAVYNMDDLSELFPGGPWGAIRSAFYGGRYGFQQDSFYPYDDYFYFNGYGNLVSIPDHFLQDYFNQFESEILEFVNANGIELDGVEPMDEVKEVMKFDDRIELRASAAGDYMQDGKLDIGLYADDPLFWNDITIELNDWIYLYDANRGKWYDIPGPYMIYDLRVFEQMLEQTIVTGEPVVCYEIEDEDILVDLNKRWEE